MRRKWTFRMAEYTTRSSLSDHIGATLIAPPLMTTMRETFDGFLGGKFITHSASRPSP